MLAAAPASRAPRPEADRHHSRGRLDGQRVGRGRDPGGAARIRSRGRPRLRAELTSAQGDLATLPSLIDAAIDSRPRSSWPCRTHAGRSRCSARSRCPIVFHLLSDPFAAGAGTSDTDHLPNVTGVYSPGLGRSGTDQAGGADPPGPAQGASASASCSAPRTSSPSPSRTG